MALIQIPDRVAKLPIIKKFAFALANTKAPTQTKGVQIQVINEFKDRNRKDNQDWMDAQTLATDPEKPRWAMLQDIFDKVSEESHFQSQWELRTDACTCSNYMIINKQGEIDQEKTKIFKGEWFEKFMLQVLEAKLKKYSVLQLQQINPILFYHVPRRNYVLQQKLVLAKVSEDKGIDLNNPAFASSVITIEDYSDFGIINSLVPVLNWKANTIMAWAEATEKYGLPPLIATSTKSDTKSLQTIQDMLKQAGESLVAVLPEGTKIEVMSNYEKIDPEKMFGGLMKACDEYISKRLVGGTMISDNGSSRSQSETHQKNLDDKIAESDKRRIEYVVNGQLIPILRANGIAFADGDVFAFDRTQKLTLKEHFEIVKGILEKYDVEEDWLIKTFQVPIIGKKVAAQPTTNNGNFNNASTAFAAALGAKGILLPNYIQDAGCCQHKEAVADGFDFLSELSDLLINTLFKGEDTLAVEIQKSVATYTKLQEGLFDGWSNRLNVGYDAIDHHCLAAMEYNLFEFSRIKEAANVIALNELLFDENKNVRSFDEFKVLAKQYLNNADVNYLRTEYNHTIAVGQNASRWQQFQREKDTVTSFVQWQTVGDSRVRSSHQVLDGKVFNLSDESGLGIWPPSGWNCRCEMIQYLGKPPADSITTNAEALKLLDISEKSQWNINRGKTEQVFTANEMYLKKLNIATEQNQLSYKFYKLKSMAELNDLPIIELDNSITKDNVSELWKPKKGEKFMRYEDYLGRKIVMQEKTFKKHTKDYYTNNEELRHQLFPFIQDILTNPDEVYFYKYEAGKDYYQTSYIKHFEGRSLVVSTGLKNNNVEINTWFNIKGEEEKVRKGYLIHKSKKP